MSNTKDNDKKYPYLGLGPTIHLKEFTPYLKMLEGALKNQYTNIALSGNYGSGKTSVIKTFKDYQKNILKKKIIDISLASFITIGTKPKNDHKEYLSIERSILQQLFYKVKSNKIPFSRFSKIINLTFLKALLIVITASITLSLGIFIIKPNFFKNLIISFLNNSFPNKQWISILLIILFLLLILTIFTYILRFIIKKIRVSKFHLSKIEIEINDNESSIFNKYLDEIIYFFESSNYDIVIIEDLDRLNKPDIFVKLRELNNLINKSDHVSQTVTFIYCIGDSVFKNSERTKFFDLIIPIVPVINKANSGEKFKELLKEQYLDPLFSDDFLYSVSRYIDDMRILKSSLNEFLLYKNRINIDHNDNETLFSLMLYKTMYSGDFEDIDKNKGNLYSAFINKKNAISKITNDINSEINEKEETIRRIEKEILQNTDELRGAFYNVVLKKGAYRAYKIDRHLEINENTILNNSFNFEEFNNFNSILLIHPRGGNFNKSYSFDQFNNEFSINGLSFYERYKALDNNKDIYIEELKKEITTLEINKKDILNYSLSEYLSEFGKQGILNESNELLEFLLIEGYIKENYMKYISCFYDGKLTKGDAEFLLNIQNRKVLEFDYSLEKKEEIIKQLDLKYFKHEGILNYNMVEYLLENQNIYSNQIRFVIELISKLNERAVDFIKNYFEGDMNNNISKDFVKRLCNKCDSIWKFVQYESSYEEERINKYLKSIILYANIGAIKKINTFDYGDTGKQNSLKKYIENKKDFVLLFYMDEDKEKIKEVLKELDIKFKNIYVDNQDVWLFDYIANGNYYEINETMIDLILSKYQEPGIIIKSNYTGIIESEIQELIDYINNNVHDYLKNVYFDKKQKLNEKSSSVEKLLKLKLTNEEQEKIIGDTKFIAKNFKGYDNALWPLLLTKLKLEFSWESVFKYYEKFGFDGILEEYLNKNLPYVNLNDIIDTTKYEDIYKPMIDELLLNNKINDIHIFQRLISPTLRYDLFNIEGVSEERLKILIKYGSITFSVDNFIFLKVNYPGILINYIINNINEFIANIENCEIDNSDFTNIIMSNSISDNNKGAVLEYANSHEIEAVDKNSALAVTYLIINNNTNIKLSQLLLTSIYKYDIGKSLKIKLLLNQYEYLEKDEIQLLLKNLGGEYARITIPNMRPTLNANDDNKLLAQLLKKSQFISSWSIENNNVKINNKRS